MSIVSSINKAEHGIQKIIIGAVLTGIALVIAKAWGEVIQKSVMLLVNKVRCEKYLVLNKKDEYKQCEKDESIFGLLINAVITSIVLYIIILVLFGNTAIKKIKK